MKAYTTFQLQSAFGWKIDLLKDWRKRGFITPSIQEACGAGTKNLFSKLDVYMIRLFEYLVNAGFSRSEASERVKNVRFWLYNLNYDISPDMHAFLFFIKRPESELLGDSIPVSEKEYAELPISEILKKFDKEPKDFNDIFIINFKRLMAEVDSKLS